jgi:CO/xanthine dehydrogenase Mo-binding subunit
LVTGSHAPSVLADHYGAVVEKWGATVDVTTPDVGGSFGAKWEHPTHLVCLAFAHRLKRDVAMVMSRRDDMIAGRTRLGMRIKMRIGATDDGELVAKQTQVWADNGAYSLHGPPVMMAATIRGDNLYKFAAVKAEGQLVYTNTMPSECFRGFGIPQSTFAQEQLIDELARKLEIDPIEMRRRNATGTGDTSIHGWQVGSCGFRECLDMVSKSIKDHETPADDDRYKFGYGLSANIHCVSNSGYDESLDLSNVHISVGSDGVICLASGEVELGCGTAEVVLRTVERELELSRDQMRVVLGHTATGPFGRGSFASRTSFFIAHAAIIACQKFSEKCRVMAEDLGLSNNASVADIISRAVERGQSDVLYAEGQYLPTGVNAADENGYGNISMAYTFGVHGACVKVDTLTGKATVERYWAAHDAGSIVNPLGAKGQVIGGVIQGIGMALSEEASVNDKGQLSNPGYLDDRVATFPDAPHIEVFFPDVYETSGPVGAKTVGEPPIIPVAGCIANAIYDAIGIRQRQLPMTPERVWSTLHSHKQN